MSHDDSKRVLPPKKYIEGLPDQMKTEGARVDVPGHGTFVKLYGGWKRVEIEVQRDRVFKQTRPKGGLTVTMRSSDSELFETEESENRVPLPPNLWMEALRTRVHRDPEDQIDAFESMVDAWLEQMPSPNEQEPMSAKHSALVDARDSIAQLRKSLSEDSTEKSSLADARDKAALAGMDLAWSLLKAFQPYVRRGRSAGGSEKGARLLHTRFIREYLAKRGLDAKPLPAWKAFQNKHGDSHGVEYSRFREAFWAEKKRLRNLNR